MNKYIVLILFVFLSVVSKAEIFEIGLSGGLVKYSLPFGDDVDFHTYTKVKPGLYGSFKALINIPKTGLSAGIGADMHNIVVKKEVSGTVYYSTSPVVRQSITITELAHPAIPFYLRLDQKIVSGKLLSLSVGINAGFVIAPGQYSGNTIHNKAGQSANTYTYLIQMGKGFGYIGGINVSGAFNITKHFGIDVNLQPRYYNIKVNNERSYYNIQSPGITTSVGTNGSIQVLYPNAVKETIRYQAFAFPFTLGLTVRI